MFEISVRITAELCARSNKTCSELNCKTVRFLRSSKHASGETKVVQGENGE